MKWFQCDSDAPDDPKIKAVIRKGLPSANPGQAAAGALWLLWCYVANHGAGLPGEGIDHQGLPLPLSEMADECLFDSEADLIAFLNFLAAKQHIDPVRWSAGQVMLPAMLSRADRYARSKGRQVARPGEKSPGTARPGEKSPGKARTGKKPPLQTNKQTTQDKQDKTQEGPSAPPLPDLQLEPPASPGPTVDQLVATWNQHRTKGPKVQQVDDKRRAAFQKALDAQPDLVKWAAVIAWADGQAVANAPGTGSYPTWRLDLDFLTKPGHLQKWFERMDAAKANPPSAASGRVAPTEKKFAAAAAERGDGDGDE